MKKKKLKPVQSKEDLERFYSDADPWKYDGDSDDSARKARLLALLPRRDYSRTVDVGCGNGYLTLDLPGDDVIGIDISENAIQFARQRAERREDAARFSFRAASLFELPQIVEPNSVDLFIITGVLYPQYIGDAFATIRLMVDNILKKNGVLASCHIDGWSPWRFPYNLIDQSNYPYREFDHRLEILLK